MYLYKYPVGMSQAEGLKSGWGNHVHASTHTEEQTVIALKSLSDSEKGGAEEMCRRQINYIALSSLLTLQITNNNNNKRKA